MGHLKLKSDRRLETIHVLTVDIHTIMLSQHEPKRVTEGKIQRRHERGVSVL
jgi:hypothetical protein